MEFKDKLYIDLFFKRLSGFITEDTDIGAVFLGFINSNQIEVKQKDCYLINPSNNSSPVNNPT